MRSAGSMHPELERILAEHEARWQRLLEWIAAADDTPFVPAGVAAAEQGGEATAPAQPAARGAPAERLEGPCAGR